MKERERREWKVSEESRNIRHFSNCLLAFLAKSQSNELDTKSPRLTNYRLTSVTLLLQSVSIMLNYLVNATVRRYRTPRVLIEATRVINNWP